MPLAICCPPTKAEIAKADVGEVGVALNVYVTPPFVVARVTDAELPVITEKSAALPVVAPEVPDTTKVHKIELPAR